MLRFTAAGLRLRLAAAPLRDGNQPNPVLHRVSRCHLTCAAHPIWGLVSKVRHRVESAKHLLRCRETLRGMRTAGVFLDPPLVNLLEQLEAI